MIGLVAEKLPQLVSEISNPVGGVITILFVRLVPDTEKFCSEEGELIDEDINEFKVPVAITVGEEDTLPVTDISSKKNSSLLPLPETSSKNHLI